MGKLCIRVMRSPLAMRFIMIRQSLAGRQWLVACALVIGIKLAFFLADPMPQFFQGDSNDFIWTSLTGYIWPVRSFTYGYVIALLTRCSHSLTSLVFAQCIASAGTALLVYHLARTYLRIMPWLAIAAACCCALDPMQLYYERAVMTEAFSTFLFALGVNLALSYIDKPRVLKLLALALVCTAAITLRLTLLLATLVLCLLPPLCLFVSRGFELAKCDTPRRIWPAISLRLRKQEFLKYLTHLVFVGGCLYALHYGYKQINFILSDHGTASYMNAQGLIQIAGVASVLIPEDAPDPRVAGVIRDFDQKILRDRHNRAFHLFNANGLVNKLGEAIPDPAECDNLCGRTVRHAMRRAPWQVLLSGWNGWLDYFDYAAMKERILDDQGARADLPETQLQLLRDHFSLAVPADWGKRMTVTKRLQLRLKCWNYALMITPLLGAACVCTAWKKNFLAVLTLELCVLALLPAPCIFAITVMRYLHPLGFALPVFLAILLQRACDMRSRLN
jgi:hypothetical protein